MCMSSPSAPTPPPPTEKIKQAKPRMDADSEKARRAAIAARRTPSLQQTLGGGSSLLG